MRKDMDCVIVDGYRTGGRFKSPKGENRIEINDKNNDRQSKNESMGKKWKKAFDEKIPSDRLGPLYRYLLSKVGCKWDDVYSEICSNYSQNSMLQSHLRDHVFDFVALDCFEYNGEICERQNGLHTLYRRRQLYVMNGILCKLERKREKHKEPKVKFKTGICPLYFKGIWYEVQLVEIKSMPVGGVYDQFLGKVSDRYQLSDFYGNYIYCTKKRQMNKKEIKKLSCTNEPTRPR